MENSFEFHLRAFVTSARSRRSPFFPPYVSRLSAPLARLWLLKMSISSYSEMPCPDEATINQIFDAVSYSKGGSVLKVRFVSSLDHYRPANDFPVSLPDVEQLCRTRRLPQGSVSTLFPLFPSSSSPR